MYLNCPFPPRDHQILHVTSFKHLPKAPCIDGRSLTQTYYITVTSHIHSYNTGSLRSFTSGKFYVKSSRTEIQNKTFKRVLRKLLFDILDEDDYNQIPVIIKKSVYVERYTC